MGYKYFNSIISTHRERLGSVRSFLRSIEIASELVDKDSFEVVITNLGDESKVDAVIQYYQQKLNIKHCKIKYGGLFWKTKALNHCALNAEGKYLTMLDIDAVIPPQFLKSIEDFYADSSKENIKLAHRVKFLDPKHSKHLSKREFDKDYLNYLISKDKIFRLAFERYTKEEHKLRGLKDHERKWAESQALGNSHYTMRKEDFMAIGGYDERFIGWACEDMDFNRRAFLYLGKGTIRPVATLTVYSMHHNRMAWMNRKQTRRNEKLYDSNRKHNVIKLPVDPERWGKF